MQASKKHRISGACLLRTLFILDGIGNNLPHFTFIPADCKCQLRIKIILRKFKVSFIDHCAFLALFISFLFSQVQILDDPDQFRRVTALYRFLVFLFPKLIIRAPFSLGFRNSSDYLPGLVGSVKNYLFLLF